MRAILSFMLLLGLVSLANGDGPALPEFKTPPIEFANKHDAYSVADPAPVSVEDRLLIGDITPKQITFFFFITGSNLHICSGSGVAKRIDGTSYYYREISGSQPVFEQGKVVQKPTECQLRIDFDSTNAVLDDEGGSCHEVFCGMRASIDNAKFSKKQ